MTQSEVTRLREQIEREYQAVQQVFTGFTPTGRHDYINKRQVNIEGYFEALKKILPPEEAILIVVQAEQNVYGCESSSGTTS